MPRDPSPEFDSYASGYEELLKDPIRDCFSGGTGSAFFHERKHELIRSFWSSQERSSDELDWLDLGCGRGDLLRLSAGDFRTAVGCDPSPGMVRELTTGTVRHQPDLSAIPFEAESFDFITAVCVFHHVAPALRHALMKEAVRVLRPGGVLSIIEHNPYNPATRLIVSRTPVDRDAILLSGSEATQLLAGVGLKMVDSTYFLYLPERLWRTRPGAFLERGLKHVPVGGQYAVFGLKESVS